KEDGGKAMRKRTINIGLIPAAVTLWLMYPTSQVMASLGPLGGAVISLAVNPNSPTTVYAGIFGGPGVLKSVDGGETWSVANQGITGRNVGSLVVDPGEPNTVYAGSTAAGIFRSTDGGASWSPTGLTSGTIACLAMSDTNTIYAGAYSGGVYKST